MEQWNEDKAKLQIQFQKLLTELNPEQKKAVSHIEGPALVLAGPGTGKTHLVATRIGNILLQTDTPPQSILCLTYSDAGATAMRNRLVKLIGPEAYKITVSTYHAFCNRVIQENPELFGRGRDLQLISDLERSEYLEKLMQSLPANHVFMVKYKHLHLFHKRLNHLFASMKRESWSESWMLAAIETYVQSLATNPEFLYQKKSGQNKKGDLKSAKIAEVVEKMEMLKAGVKLYASWQKMLKDNGRFEYDDMITWVIEALNTQKFLKLNLQERYLYVVVDEFQDTNASQNQIIGLLTDYWESPNLFIVGDDDQSIYEFQGARLNHLIEFHEQYREHLTLTVLQDNYRSSQAILDCARRVIEHNALRAMPKLGLGNTKILKAVRSYTSVPELRAFDSEMSELAWIVQKIQDTLADGVAPEEIAVIYRTNKEGERLGQLLRAKEIGFSTKRDVNVLQLGLIDQILHFIRAILQELKTPLQSDARLFHVLHAPFMGIKALDLALILVQLRTQADDAMALRQVLQDEAWLKKAGVKEPHIIVEAGKCVEALITSAATDQLLHFWSKLLRDTGVLRWCMVQPDHIWWTQVVHTFTQFLQGEVLRNKHLTLEALLPLIDGMSNLNLTIPLIQTAQTEKGINLVTAHSSKGLEYHTVFIFNCLQQIWQEKAGGSRNQMSLPPTITLSGEEDALEANRRLFYVAMTRAKVCLYLSFSRRDSKLKDQQPTQFILETGITTIEQSVDAEKVAEAQLAVVGSTAQIEVELPKLPFVAAFVDTYVLSLSGLNRYLKCPLAFYYEHVLRLPDMPSDAARFGTLMHKAMEQFMQRRNQAKTANAIDVSVLIETFKREMANHRHLFGSAADYFNKLQYGTKCLEGYFQANQNTWPDKCKLEVSVQQVQVDGVPIKGVIDRLEHISTDHLRVIDYKTGKLRKDKISEPTELLPYGGDYYRQGLFYKILVDASPYLQGTAREVIISYLEPDDKGKFVNHQINIDAQEVHWMRNLIKTTYAAIKDQQFDHGCGEKDCPYCNLHRVSLIEDERNEDIWALDD
jgi:DNA helicase II / ATP-dependent DNA helicase PcrA